MRPRSSSIFLLFFLGTLLALAQPAAPRPVVGLALEGGNAYGMAEIGVLAWMEEHRVPVDRIAGTSMGSLVGAMYSAGVTPAQLKEIAASDAFTHVFALQPPYADASFRRRQDRRELLQSLTIGLHGRPAVRNALLTDSGVRAFMNQWMAAYNREDLDFDQLPIPFRCLATDLSTMDRIVFTHGSLVDAVRASISIPGVFAPVEGPKKHTLVDGGILDNLPTDLVRGELKADRVIAVHLETASEDPDTSSIVSVLTRAFDAGIQLNVRQSLKLADIVVAVPLQQFAGTDYAHGAQMVEAGYKAAEQNREALLTLALSPEDWQRYLEERKSRMPGRPGRVRELRVEGGSPAAIRNVSYQLRTLIGHPLSPWATAEALKQVQSNGGITARWQSFQLPPAESAETGDIGLAVRLKHDAIGPPYLLVDPEAAAATSNISRFLLTMRLVDQNLGGFGSELRGEIRVGYRTDFQAEYYRLLTPGGWFLEPNGRVAREPVYVWQNQRRTSEHFQQTLETGLDLGRTFSNELQVAAQWRADRTRWSLTTGSGGGADQDGTSQTGALNLVIDRAQSGTISPNGFRLSATAGAFFHAEGSDNAPLLKLQATSSRSWRSDIFSISTEINSYLRARVAEPYRFTLGGPLRLSASSFDEYRGTDVAMARAGLMHRVALLPTGPAQGLYLLLAYEAGEVWSPDARTFLRQDGVTGLVANTPVGLFTFGISVGDAGRRKVFVTLGRWF